MTVTLTEKPDYIKLIYESEKSLKIILIIIAALITINIIINIIKLIKKK